MAYIYMSHSIFIPIQVVQLLMLGGHFLAGRTSFLRTPVGRTSVGPGLMGQEFSGNCDVASRNSLLHSGATKATRSRRSDSEEAPPCRTRVLGAELDGSLATANFRLV